MRERCDSQFNHPTLDATLSDLFGTLWAISVITRRMAGQINAIMKKKGETCYEQNIGTVCRCCGAAQVR